MPELPEVETVRAGIEQHVVGRTVATAEVFNPRSVRRDVAGPAGFAAAMTGRTFLRAERRGKYLWFALDDGRGARPMAQAATVSGPPPGDISRGDDPPVSAFGRRRVIGGLCLPRAAGVRLGDGRVQVADAGRGQGPAVGGQPQVARQDRQGGDSIRGTLAA